MFVIKNVINIACLLKGKLWGFPAFGVLLLNHTHTKAHTHTFQSFFFPFVHCNHICLHKKLKLRLNIEDQKKIGLLCFHLYAWIFYRGLTLLPQFSCHFFVGQANIDITQKQKTFFPQPTRLLSPATVLKRQRGKYIFFFLNQ